MTDPLILLEPGQLWKKTVKQTLFARKTGALKSIETDYQFIESNGISFLVRHLANIARKEQAQQQRKQEEKKTNKKFNPFLPYEEDLFVSDISPTHLCLLNKFNVVDHHLLIVTREFESQENWLNLADFIALGVCLREIDGLAFYNGGKLAGASQEHKHLQILPLPFVPEECYLPIEPAIEGTKFHDSWGKIPHFTFRHAISFLSLTESDSAIEVGQKLLSCYYSLLSAVGLEVDSNSPIQSGAYNLLVTQKWMLIVPRVQESCHSISINSLGFAGSLFVRDRQQIKLLEEITPMTILSKVAFSEK
ncbi:MAG: phosphorylase [Xenococcaceae cyanobacterium]